MQGKVFDGTATRPRRRVLLWSAAAEDGLSEPVGVAAAAAAAAADGSCGNGNGKAAL